MNKNDLKNLFYALDKYPIKASRFIIDINTARDIGLDIDGMTFDMIEAEIEMEKEHEEKIRKIIIDWLGKNQENVLKKVINEKFPEYKELLEKLMVLK